MKTNFTTLKSITAATLFFCLVTNNAKAEGKPFTDFSFTENEDPKEKKPAKKAKTKAAAFVSRNNDAVKIYPDIIKREMHVVAKQNKGEAITFFVFDVQGALVQQQKMQPKEHHLLTGLKKGVYIYRIFSGDEETATGKFEIR